MRILFTTRDQYFSNLIRNITQEGISHVALQINDWLVVHSNVKGVHIQTLDKFRRENDVIFSLAPTEGIPKRRILEAIARAEGRAYDWKGVLYLGTKLTLRRLFPWFMPKQNFWQESGMDFCTELIHRLVINKENSMLTPGQLAAELINSGKFNIY